MDRIQWEVTRHIFQLPRLNVLFLKLWQRLTDVSGTEGSLVIGELDEREHSLFVALREGLGDINCGVDITNGRAIVPTR